MIGFLREFKRLFKPQQEKGAILCIRVMAKLCFAKS